MTDTRNMTLRNLVDYYDPKLPDSALITVPNGLLRELKEKELRDRDYSPTRVEDMGFPE
jgi:hypothetical protein